MFNRIASSVSCVYEKEYSQEIRNEIKIQENARVAQGNAQGSKEKIKLSSEQQETRVNTAASARCGVAQRPAHAPAVVSL